MGKDFERRGDKIRICVSELFREFLDILREIFQNGIEYDYTVLLGY
jgi:hypothetical protein